MCPGWLYKYVATPPVGWYGIVSVNEEKLENFPSLSVILSSMRVTIELLTEHSQNPKYSTIKKAKREPQLLQMVSAVGSASNHSPSSCLLSGNTMLPGNQSGKTNPIEAFNGNNDSSDNVSPLHYVCFSLFMCIFCSDCKFM